MKTLTTGLMTSLIVTFISVLTACNPPASITTTPIQTPAPVTEEPKQDETEIPEEPSAPLPTPPKVVIFPNEPEKVDPLLNVDLLKLQKREIQFRSAAQILDMNNQALKTLDAVPMIPREKYAHGNERVLFVSPTDVQNVIDAMNENPVVGYFADSKYAQKSAAIGYCFGRAAFAHLTFLRMGLAKESIRKVWLVGPMTGGSIRWQFHVTTAVRISTGEWMAVDNFRGRAMEIKEWAASFYPSNSSHNNLRVYVTAASKFTPSLGSYNRVQLGLDLSAEKDWYRHYFVDLFQWQRNQSLSSAGLYDLRNPNRPQQ